MNTEMKLRYRLFRRSNGLFFIEDTVTRKQESLRTRDKAVAKRLFSARNEAYQQPAINLQIARAYIRASDPMISQRTWLHAFDELIKTKEGANQERWFRATKDKAYDSIKGIILIETQAEHLLHVLQSGTVSTNVFLRKLHNFCIDMNWLPWPIIPKRQWPAVKFKQRRPITWEEHQRILEREPNPERRKFYELCWYLGASQGDIANLTAEDVDWENKTLSFFRRKTDVPAIVHLGEGALNVLKDLPGEGLLFPYLSQVRSGDRATEFKQRCRGLGIEGVTLHSYRYAWAVRAREVGYPERYAQEALGHNSKAVHRAYARKAKVNIPSLEEYEKAKARDGKSADEI